MRKIAKFLIVTAVMTVLFAVPAMAEITISSENTDQMVNLLNQHDNTVIGQVQSWSNTQVGSNSLVLVNNHTQSVIYQLAQEDKVAADNHILFLERKLANAKDIEATRLTQYNTFAGVYANDPGRVADALNQYNQAVAARVAAEQNLAAAKVKLAKWL